MLDDVERNVDRTDSKLSSAMRKMAKFIRDTQGMRQAFLDASQFVVVVGVLTHGRVRRHQVGVVHHDPDHRPRHLARGSYIGLIMQPHVEDAPFRLNYQITNSPMERGVSFGYVWIVLGAWRARTTREDACTPHCACIVHMILGVVARLWRALMNYWILNAL